MDTLQIILISGLLLLSLINVVSLSWALRLDSRLRKRPVPKVYEVHVEGTKVFNEIDMRQVEQYATAQLQQATRKAAEQLSASMTATVGQLSTHLSDMATTTLSQEFEKYRISLETLRSESIEEFSKLEKELSDKRTERLEALDKEIAKEYEARMDTFNAKLNDVISSYLLEALGNQVDLGSQSAYIFAALDQHKDDIKRDMLL